ncbi:hypothetical protein RJT34_21552 [Clitoria ternatea]|uniref:Uncharacterized protein n=1 Tax=Clitoria ternatea TaxID=43366 RepID=A0AAN9IVG7_CLITE
MSNNLYTMKKSPVDNIIPSLKPRHKFRSKPFSVRHFCYRSPGGNPRPRGSVVHHTHTHTYIEVGICSSLPLFNYHLSNLYCSLSLPDLVQSQVGSFAPQPPLHHFYVANYDSLI